VPAPNLVQGVEVLENELLANYVSYFCTEFSTEVLKTFIRAPKKSVDSAKK
jgi:hypothetical protein